MNRVSSDSLGLWLCIDGMCAGLSRSGRNSYSTAATVAVIGTRVKRAAKFPSAALKLRHHVACGVRWSADIGSFSLRPIIGLQRVASVRASKAMRINEIGSCLECRGSHTPVVTGNANRYTQLVGIPPGIGCISDELSEMTWPRDFFIASTRQTVPVVLLLA